MREVLGLFVRRAGVDVLSRVATLVLLFALARCWSVAIFGRFILALSIGSVAALIMDGGCHLLFLRELGRSYGETRPGSGSSFHRVWDEFVSAKIITVVLGLLVALLAVIIIWPWEGYLFPLSLIGWAVGQSWVEFLNVVPNVTGRIHWSAVMMGGHRLLAIGSALAVVLWKSGGLTEVGLCLGGGSLLAAGVAHFLTNHRFFDKRPNHFHWSEGRHHLRRAGIVGGALVVYTVGFRMGIFLLPHLSDAVQVGYYGAVNKLVESALMVPAALMLVSTRFIVSSPDVASQRTFTWRIAFFIVGAALLWFLGGQWAASFGIRSIFGPSWLPAVPVFRIILVASVLGFINCFLYHLLVLRDLLASFLWIEIAALIVSALATFFLAGRWGAIGAALGLVLFEAVRLLMNGVTVWRKNPQ